MFKMIQTFRKHFFFGRNFYHLRIFYRVCKGSVNFCVFALTCFLTKWTLSWSQIEKRSLMGCLFFKSSHSTFSSSGREKRPILEIWTTHAKNEHDVTFVFALSIFQQNMGSLRWHFTQNCSNSILQMWVGIDAMTRASMEKIIWSVKE